MKGINEKENMANKLNGMAKWIVVALAIGGLIFNSGILYNDVKHLTKQVADIKQDIKDLQAYIIEMR